ncbi:hypothetical protein KTT_44850 [Tengunoibacter tsumagoiensis]|uniref:Uncharacterized protein n=2 Tax=Tengunoibacter tsumagoiensis TaxID=2014871 RepID=A0A402A6G9_9CHLR|nr:hypothetical protein KTT_44850 [Tengunoibacter tsumagoiensis]
MQMMVIYPHRYRRRRALIGFGLCSLLVLGLDALVVWSFGIFVYSNMPPPIFVFWALVDVLWPLVLTVFVGWSGWSCAVYWRKWRSDQPLLMIDTEGMHIHFLRGVDNVLLPWEEIAWIAVFPIVDETFLSVSLKDVRRWWTRYGNGKSRFFWRDPLTHAQLNLRQAGLSLPVEHIFRFIEENYAQECAASNVHLRPDSFSLLLKFAKCCKKSFTAFCRDWLFS